MRFTREKDLQLVTSVLIAFFIERLVVRKITEYLASIMANFMKVLALNKAVIRQY